jgi:hypothetical protein
MFACIAGVLVLLNLILATLLILERRKYKSSDVRVVYNTSEGVQVIEVSDTERDRAQFLGEGHPREDACGEVGGEVINSADMENIYDSYGGDIED